MSPPSRSEEATEERRRTLVSHARDLVAREGPDALTMRALAAEAGCAVGLPYKVFADRREIVVAICQAELAGLADAATALEAAAGTGTVGGNLLRFSQHVLDSPAVGLVHEIVADAELTHAVAAGATGRPHGEAFEGFEAAYGTYLQREQALGRVRREVDAGAFAFLLAGAVHNLVVAGAAWPRPSRDQLASWLDATAAALAPDEPDPGEMR